MSGKEKQPDQKQKPGPEGERLKLNMDWEEAAKKMTRKKRPKEGWPEHPDRANDSGDDENSQS